LTTSHVSEPPATRFRILGPVEYSTTHGWSSVKANKQRTLLATLLLNANRVVPAQQLYSELWGDKPRARVSGLLAGCVWRLRSAIGDQDATMLATRAAGYTLKVAPQTLDLHEYQDLIARGRTLRAEGDLLGAADSFTRAINVWRGDALADVTITPSIMAEQARLEESKIAVLEARCGVELDLGRHEEILPELKMLVSQHPLRERLHGHLMTALYRCGQQADALGTYTDLRQLLINELGIEPSKPLRELQHRILVEDPVLLAPTGTTVPVTRLPDTLVPVATPRLLPPAPPVFVGRDAELARLTSRLVTEDTVMSVHGVVGAGKTALALTAAHAVADHFVDGQVFVDMRGSTREPLRASEAIDQLSSAFGLPALAADDRTLLITPWLPQLAGKRILVILDDVVDLKQVRPIVSPPSGWTVLLTGRGAVGATDGNNHLLLGPLPVASALDLLRRLVGARRVADELPAAAELARLCEYWPLAIRIAAGKLASRPGWRIADLVSRLAEPGARLDLLTSADSSLRDRLRSSTALLSQRKDAAALRALRLLGTLDLPVVTESVVAAMLDTSDTAAHLIAERLVDVGLLQSLDICRYRVPAVVRLFAKEIPGDAMAERTAVQRVVDHCTEAARHRADLALGVVPWHGAARCRTPPHQSPAAWYRTHGPMLSELSLLDQTDSLPKAVDRLRRALFSRRVRT
jgi:DNA-binding SARP family transcriptional activator